MTYTVSGGTLNPTHSLTHFCSNEVQFDRKKTIHSAAYRCNEDG